jgi:hypothetical protein
MMDGITIEFFCYENDKPYEIQLEPECYLFKVRPDNTLKFVAKSDSPFAWAVRLDNGIQLFPDTKGQYDITVYENDFILLDWFKYM